MTVHKSTLKKMMLALARQYCQGRNLLGKYPFRNSGLFSTVLETKQWSWKELDRVFTMCRRKLYEDHRWLFGPKRVYEVGREAFDAISYFSSVEGKVYCDMGCGSYHPFGTSAIMFLNGVSSAIAIDAAEADPARAAEALFDLLIDASIKPDVWHWSGIEREDFRSRISLFDLEALGSGNLTEGIKDVPLTHYVYDILDLPLANSTIDIMSSRAVLEHFMDFKTAVCKLYDLMCPGGISFHHIDVRDHRYYKDASRHQPWSFLTEEDGWSDGECNRLRYGEIKKYLEEQGFEILRFGARRETMPMGFRKKLKGRFAEMPDEELEVTGINCVVRKPMLRS